MDERKVNAINTSMTDEERLALCKKLDRELDEFIDSLEKKRYTEGWNQDKWEEEMDKHPFFMKSSPGSDEMSPLAEGLAKLKYDPEENTPLELANNYKEDGNFNFKHKNYRLAIMGYTEGLRQKCDSAEVNATLYQNRAAAHWQLNNFRSALLDSEKALSFKPEYTKARIRAAKSALHIGQYEKCIEHCNKLLEIDPNDTQCPEILDTAKNKFKAKQRDERKSALMKSKKDAQRLAVINAIIERGIRISNCDDPDDLDLSKLEPTLPGSQESIVHVEDGILKWPVLLMYPEYQMTDFIKCCPENVTLMQQLEQLFPAPWDEENKYTKDSINVYFEGRDMMPYIVNPMRNLGDILLAKNLEIKAGTPVFFVLPRGSPIEKNFLLTYL